MKKLIILDRDGVINVDSDDYIKSPDEWKPIPGSIEAIAELNQAGYTVAVATNQSGLSRGLFDVNAFTQVNEKMQSLLRDAGGAIDRLFYCPHGPWDFCECRKPKPGLFKQINEYYKQPLFSVPAVGDSLRDLQASIQLGCRPILVKTGKGERTLTEERNALASIKPAIFDDLASAVQAIVAQTVC